MPKKAFYGKMVECLHLPGHVAVITAYLSTNYNISELATVHRVTVLELHLTNLLKNHINWSFYVGDH